MRCVGLARGASHSENLLALSNYGTSRRQNAQQLAAAARSVTMSGNANSIPRCVRTCPHLLDQHRFGGRSTRNSCGRSSEDSHLHRRKISLRRGCSRRAFDPRTVLWRRQTVVSSASRRIRRSLRRPFFRTTLYCADEKSQLSRTRHAGLFGGRIRQREGHL